MYTYSAANVINVDISLNSVSSKLMWIISRHSERSKSRLQQFVRMNLQDRLREDLSKQQKGNILLKLKPPHKLRTNQRKAELLSQHAESMKREWEDEHKHTIALETENSFKIESDRIART